MANIKKTSCLVLLSSYNGEKYIAEQISSILSQEKVEVRIIIRDDGSKDKTLEILNRIEDERIEVIAGDNLGCIQSFSWLVNYVYDSRGNAMCTENLLLLTLEKINLTKKEQETSDYMSVTYLVPFGYHFMLVPSQQLVMVREVTKKNYFKKI